MVLLEKLVKIEGKYGMVGTIFGIVVILICTILSLCAIALIVKLDFKVIEWVCRHFLNYKFR